MTELSIERLARWCATTFLLALLWTAPALAGTVTLSFEGEITEVLEQAPPPFSEAAVGSAWTLTYTFETDALDVDPSDLAGLYHNPVLRVTLTIDDASVTGTPGWAVPGQLSSAIAVNLNTGFADYSVQASLPDSSAWAQVMLYDDQGTPFENDTLPQALPQPLDEAFPNFKGFFLRLPFSTTHFLKGEIGQIELQALSQVRTNLEILSDPEYTTVILVVDSERFGAGGIASGMFSCPGCEVMGVEPSPFRWIVDPADGVPDDGTAVVRFVLDPYGEVAGVEPSPFRVLMVADEQTVGEISFRGVNGTFPNILGNLALDGLYLERADGSMTALDGFDIFDALDQVIAGDTRADFRVSAGTERTTVDLLVNSALFGAAGVANGTLSCPGCEVMGVEPSPFRWLVDPESGTPADGEAAISFILDPYGEVAGIEPSPFRILAGSGDQILGEMDFSQVSGGLGSLYLSGVRIKLADGSYIAVDDLHAEESAVEIDIKPGSYPNSINLSSSGVIPVAILSSPVFDAAEINPDTVRLSGAAVKLVGKSGKYLAHLEDVNGDGLDDLVCQVLTEQLQLEPGATNALLEAETVDGLTVTGRDTVYIVPD